MDKKLHEVFDKIRAEDELREKTEHFLKREIEKRNRPYRMLHMRALAICASFVLLMVIGRLSYVLYFTPSTFIDVDVNPSIELRINRFGRVLETESYNDDAVALLKGLDVKRKSYEEAVQMLLDKMREEGYLKQNGLVSVTVQTNRNDDETELLSEIQETVTNFLATHHVRARADVFPVSQEVRQNAGDYNLSPARYLAIEQLQEVDPTATFEGCAGHSIGEIKKLTKNHGKDHHGHAKDWKQEIERGDEQEEEQGKKVEQKQELEPQEKSEQSVQENYESMESQTQQEESSGSCEAGEKKHNGGHCQHRGY